MGSITIIEYPNFKRFADTNEKVRFFHKEYYRIIKAFEWNDNLYLHFCICKSS